MSVTEKTAVSAVVTITDRPRAFPAAGGARSQITVKFRRTGKPAALKSHGVIGPACAPGHEIIVSPIPVMIHSFLADDHFHAGLSENADPAMLPRPQLIGKPARRQSLMNAVDFGIADGIGTIEKSSPSII